MVTGRRLTVMEPKVIHNQASHRYEIWVDDKKVGHADYSVMPGERHFVHTETNPAEQGKGYAAILMRDALRDVRENSKDKVVLWNQLHQIAERNKQRFFSAEWQASIVQEYVDNMNQAMVTMNQNCTGKYWNCLRKLKVITGAVDYNTDQAHLDQLISYLNSKQSSVPV